MWFAESREFEVVYVDEPTASALVRLGQNELKWLLSHEALSHVAEIIERWECSPERRAWVV